MGVRESSAMPTKTHLPLAGQGLANDRHPAGVSTQTHTGGNEIQGEHDPVKPEPIIDTEVLFEERRWM